MSSTARSLVLGAYAGLPVRYLEPFAESLRATGFAGTFAVIAGSYDRAELSRLEALADDVVQVDYPAPPLVAPLAYLRRTRGLRRAYPSLFRVAARGHARWSRLEYRLEGLQTLRYRAYLDYLLEHDADAVLLTDLRDVVFQRDPFAEPVRELELFFEDDTVRIGTEPFNTRWLGDLVGGRELDTMRGSPASCSGTVAGTRDAVVAYLRQMVDEAESRRRPMGSHDQAVHNLLLLRGRLPDATLVANGRGRVLTLGHMVAWETNADGELLNEDGTVPAVLHQWDRHAELAARFSVDRPPIAFGR
jgi:hypothetical protein